MFDNKKTAQHSHIFMCLACLLEKRREFLAAITVNNHQSERERELQTMCTSHKPRHFVSQSPSLSPSLPGD